jgi:hypothetical protein
MVVVTRTLPEAGPGVVMSPGTSLPIPAGRLSGAQQRISEIKMSWNPLTLYQ